MNIIIHTITYIYIQKYINEYKYIRKYNFWVHDNVNNHFTILAYRLPQRLPSTYVWKGVFISVSAAVYYCLLSERALYCIIFLCANVFSQNISLIFIQSRFSDHNSWKYRCMKISDQKVIGLNVRVTTTMEHN